MTVRRLLLAMCCLGLAVPAYAQNASFGTVKMKKAEFAQQGAAPSPSTANSCVWYMDATANAIMVSCNGGAFGVLSGSGSGTGQCQEDASGNLTCNAYVSTDKDATAANKISLYPNTTARTCAAQGVQSCLGGTNAGTTCTVDSVCPSGVCRRLATILDVSGTADTNKWCLCNGTTELVCWVGTGTTGMPDCSGGKHLVYTAGVWSCT